MKNMAISHLKVILDQDICVPGTRVTGRVEISVNKITMISKIQVIMKGFAKVNLVWRGDGESARTYSSKETFLDGDNFKIPVLTGYKELQPGELFSLPFQTVLPLGLPPSFKGPTGNGSYEGSRGYIRYTTQALVRYRKPEVCMHFVWKDNLAKEVSDEKAFQVQAKVGFNDLGNPWMQGYVHKEIGNCKLFCCLFTNGIISVTLRTPKSGFVPGEEIPLNLHVENTTSRTLARLEIRMIRRITYKAEGEKIVLVNRLNTLVRGPVESGDLYSLQRETMKIPPQTFPPSRWNCKIIDVARRGAPKSRIGMYD